MKWDLHTIGSLYLIAIVRDEKLRSLRDLRADKALGHITLLKSIRREASIIAEEKWGIVRGGLRMYIHYQPSYCELERFPRLPTRALTRKRPFPCPYR